MYQRTEGFTSHVDMNVTDAKFIFDSSLMCRVMAGVVPYRWRHVLTSSLHANSECVQAKPPQAGSVGPASWPVASARQNLENGTRQTMTDDSGPLAKVDGDDEVPCQEAGLQCRTDGQMFALVCMEKSCSVYKIQD